MDMYSMTHGPMLANYRLHGDKIVLDGVDYLKAEGETMPRFLDRVQLTHMGWHREQEYQRERKRKQEAEKASKEGSIASSSNDGAAGSDSSSANNQPSVQTPEATLESIIESKIAYYLDRLNILKDKQNELEHRVDNIANERNSLLAQCELAKKALEVYHNNNKNLSVLSQTMGLDLLRQTVQGGTSESPPMGKPDYSGVGGSLGAGANGIAHTDLY